MRTKLVLAILFFFSVTFVRSEDVSGKWRGVIMGHVDNRDYFIKSDLLASKNETYSMRLNLFSGDYSGEFLLTLHFKQPDKLWIDSFKVVNEFPYTYSHIRDCFSGYFKLRKTGDSKRELDLYRNPVFRKTADFILNDSSGSYSPVFECFTSVLLKPVQNDTVFSVLEKQTDSIINSKKIKSLELAKRKVVAEKECTVKSEKVSLQIWDNNQEDGDIVSLKLNENWILTNYQLKKEKLSVPIELNSKNNQLLLFAENLGKIPPNTAAISVDDNDTTKTFILNSDMRKSETVKLILMK